MSQAAEVTSRIILDRAFIVGVNDTVTGRVVVKCTVLRSFGDKLFGPLKIVLTLSGRTKTKTITQNGKSRTVRRGRQTLFSRQQLVYDGSCEIAFREEILYPFSVKFPETVTPGPQPPTAPPAFLHPPTDPPPPTMSASGRGMLGGVYKECFVSYELRAAIFMPNMAKVKIYNAPDPTPLRFQRTHPGTAPALVPPRIEQRSATVQNIQLMLPEERPTKFKEKARAFLSSDYYPKFLYGATLRTPTVLHLGTSPGFAIKISTAAFEDRITAKFRPSIEVRRLYVKITAEVNLRVEAAIWGHRDESLEQVVYHASVSAPAGGRLALFDDEHKDEHVQAVRPLPLTLAPTFNTFNINVRYVLKAEWSVSCAGKEETLESRGVLVLMPPLEGEVDVGLLTGETVGPADDVMATAKALEAAEGGGFSDEESGDEELPSYGSAAAEASGSAGYPADLYYLPPAPMELQAEREPGELQGVRDPAELQAVREPAEMQAASSSRQPELPAYSGL